MAPRPVIFVSAVSKELKSARDLVAKHLLTLGYEPVWQDIFGTEEGDLRQMLRKKIDPCAGVVQLVGHCYGFEPSAPDERFGRVSYTQFEPLYAREQKKKVWYLMLDGTFPFDPHADEPAGLRELQAGYRQRIEGDSHLYHGINNTDALRATVLGMRDELAPLRRQGKRWAALVLALLVLLVAGGMWLIHKQGKGNKQIAQVAQTQQQASKKLDGLTDTQQQLLQAVRELPQTLAQTAQAGAKEDEATRMARAYAVLEEKLKLEKGMLEKELPKFAEQLLARADTSALDRANALFATRKFAEAEKAALEAKDKALAAAGQPVHDAIAALDVAGQAALEQIQYPRALEHFRTAAALTSEERDPVEWARVQRHIAYARSTPFSSGS